MYDIAICDDNAADRETLKQLLLASERCPDEINLYEFQSGRELLDSMKLIHFRLVFLDIQMQGMDGNETANEIRRIDNKLILVFITGFVNPTPRSFEVQPYRYLMKQMPKEELKRDIHEILYKMVTDSSMPVMTARVGERILLLYSDDIIYIEKYRRRCRLHLSEWASSHYGIKEEREILTEEKLGQIYGRLESFGFGCPHDSYIVNYRYIKEASKSHFRLEGSNIEFSITRSKALIFNRRKTMYLLSKYPKGE